MQENERTGKEAGSMALSTQINIMVLLPMFLLTGGLSLAIVMDTFIPRQQRRILLIIMILVFSLILQNMLDYTMTIHPVGNLRLIGGVYGYCVRPIILALFITLIDPEKQHHAAWILSGLNGLIYLTSFFTHLTFWYEDNHFQRGPLGFTCHIISFVLLLWMVQYSTNTFRRERRFESAIPILCVVHIIVATAADVFLSETYYISFLTIAIIISCIFYFMWLHFQILRQHERALQAEQRIQIMMSQIQPHFLYNTLSTIQALCRIDPDKAFDTLGKFGVYLRQNIKSLTNSEQIPIEQELQHTKVYAEIEMIRFPSIHVEYTINDTDFTVPPLTVQPLVENAIRHGVRIRKNGLVSVTTDTDRNYHYIIIRDNGKGFDAEAALNADSSHIGIRNVRERVEKMCGGDLTIDSEIGVGSTLTIRIPVTKSETGTGN